MAGLAQGALGKAPVAMQQLFERLPGGGGAGDADARFQYFTKHVWPRLREAGGTGARPPSRHYILREQSVMREWSIVREQSDLSNGGISTPTSFPLAQRGAFGAIFFDAFVLSERVAEGRVSQGGVTWK